MQKLTAISLLVLFLFNLAGYKLVYSYLKDQNDRSFQQYIDRNPVDDSQLFTISVNLNMPYQAQQSGFEKVNGEISVDGKVYKYVKRRIVDGKLILHCIADASKTELQWAEQKKNEREHNAANTVAKNLVTDYDFESPRTTFTIPIIPVPIKKANNEAVPTFHWVRSTVRPPDA